MKIGIIMLAAGNSRRFGSNKLLYEIQGKPMFCYILDTLYDVQKNWEQLPGEPESCLEVSVVTQYDFIAEQAEKYGFRVYHNLAPERGISSSVESVWRQIRRQMQPFFVWQINPGCPARR